MFRQLLKTQSIFSVIVGCALCNGPRLMAQTPVAAPVTPSSTVVDDPCLDPLVAATNSSCVRAGAAARSNSTPDVYVDSAGFAEQRRRAEPAPPGAQLTDFQRVVGADTGQLLPIFGSSFFRRTASTFAPVDRAPATGDYVVGPGDQLLVRLSGALSSNSRLTVSRSGSIFLPQVGSLQVAGLRYDELQKYLESEIGRLFKGFTLSVDLGQLRSIQIYVVGEARQPGSYTVGSFSTVINALFACGGPSDQGSLRNVRLMRGNRQITEVDLYDFIVHGDTAKDAHLQDGDVVVIPAITAQAALAGSARRPAIYELRSSTTIGDLIALAGGLTSVSETGSITLEREDANGSRHADRVYLNTTGKETPLKDGDILFVDHVSGAFDKTVTLRGNVATPGRFAWRPGLRLSDIVPDRMALLTPDYWLQRDALGVEEPLFQPIPDGNISPDRPTAAPGNALPPKQSDAGQTFQGQAITSVGLPTSGLSRNITGNTPIFKDSRVAVPATNRIRLPVPDIAWSYAVIERLDTETLHTVLVPFNLGKLVMDHDQTQNLPLQSGDIVTILSQADVSGPIEQQSKLIRLEGEVVGAGTYTVGPDETLADVVRRAGGLSPKAYLYGSSFFRESARIQQQQRLTEYVDEISIETTRNAAVIAASAGSPLADGGALQQKALIDQLRSLRATGRIVLQLAPDAASVADIPAVSIENGDVFRVPPRPATVSVIGAVYGQNVFFYNSRLKLADYLAMAGNTNRIADSKHAFVIRADGSILSRNQTKGVISNHFDLVKLHPGDAIVIPEKPVKPNILHNLVDYSQLFSSVGLTAASIDVLR
jgi:protein involved in polysaccharide export with SLBB domain